MFLRSTRNHYFSSNKLAQYSNAVTNAFLTDLTLLLNQRTFLRYYAQTRQYSRLNTISLAPSSMARWAAATVSAYQAFLLRPRANGIVQ